MYKVAVIIPSRGLIFSRTAEEILKIVKNIPHKFYFSHRLPIPTCFEKPLESALDDKMNTHILIVEDDMILNPGVLEEALKADVDVITADYPITKNGRGAVFRDKIGKVLYCGTGFILIKREVFDKLKRPYFRSDICWGVTKFKDSLKFTANIVNENNSYGLHDITFCMKLYKNNIPIHVLNIQLGQRKLISLGKLGTNKGAHNIETWMYIEKDYSLKRYLELPSTDKNINNMNMIMTPKGYVFIKKEHLDKISNNENVKVHDNESTIIDFNNIDI